MWNSRVCRIDFRDLTLTASDRDKSVFVVGGLVVLTGLVAIGAGGRSAERLKWPVLGVVVVAFILAALNTFCADIYRNRAWGTFIKCSGLMFMQ